MNTHSPEFFKRRTERLKKIAEIYELDLPEAKKFALANLSSSQFYKNVRAAVEAGLTEWRDPHDDQSKKRISESRKGMKLRTLRMRLDEYFQDRTRLQNYRASEQAAIDAYIRNLRRDLGLGHLPNRSPKSTRK